MMTNIEKMKQADGFKIKEFKNRIWMTVYDDFYPKSRVCQYRFQKAEFEDLSSMLRWENLHYVDGWNKDGYNDDTMINDIFNELKPVGFMSITGDKLKKLCDEADNLGFTVEFRPKNYDVCLYKERKVSEIVSMNDLIRAYKLLDFELSKNEIDRLLLAEQMMLSQVKNVFDKKNDFFTDSILNGLILGYPVESTVAFIQGEIS